MSNDRAIEKFQFFLNEGKYWKVLILPRVAELLIHKEKQRGCPLLDANKHTLIYIYQIYMYIYYLYVWDYSFEGLALIISLF